MSKITDLCTEIAEKIPQVYELGKRDERKAFWGGFQKNGTRGSYEYSFQDWVGGCFKPEYGFVFDEGEYSASGTFRRASGFNLKALTINRGLPFDTSKCTKLNSTFYQTKIGEIPPLDLSSCTQLAATFYNMQLDSGGIYTTKELVLNNVREDCTFDRAFLCPYVESILISGSIGKNIDFKDCKKLTKVSIESIMNARSKTATFTMTFSKEAVNKAFETSVGANDGSTSEEWIALDNERQNVTTSLV